MGKRQQHQLGQSAGPNSAEDLDDGLQPSDGDSTAQHSQLHGHLQRLLHPHDWLSEAKSQTGGWRLPLSESGHANEAQALGARMGRRSLEETETAAGPLANVPVEASGPKQDVSMGHPLAPAGAISPGQAAVASVPPEDHNDKSAPRAVEITHQNGELDFEVRPSAIPAFLPAIVGGLISRLPGLTAAAAAISASLPTVAVEVLAASPELNLATLEGVVINLTPDVEAEPGAEAEPGQNLSGRKLASLELKDMTSRNAEALGSMAMTTGVKVQLILQFLPLLTSCSRCYSALTTFPDA